MHVLLSAMPTVRPTKPTGGRRHYSIIGTPVMKPIFAILQSLVQLLIIIRYYKNTDVDIDIEICTYAKSEKGRREKTESPKVM